MDDLNSYLAQLLIRTPPLQARPPLQACESQGPRDFHRFSELPLEIREMIWTFSFPGARSIRVRPTLPKDGLLPLHSDCNKPQRLLVKFSYEDNNPIAALQTSGESRKAALSVYRGFIENGIYFRPDRDTLLFTGLEEMFQTLLFGGARPHSIVRLLTNTLDYEASQLAGQCARSPTTIKWSAPFLEHITTQSYVIRGGQCSRRALRPGAVH
ncbi:hypothetical protein BDZ45DRAFT_811400 [Acephala macrosclerotiorum]|nr:hypothetical protein BDZ45DRAFT_811400 [Acephala macrosclerotiorum]